jgi:hypothetical protein
MHTDPSGGRFLLWVFTFFIVVVHPIVRGIWVSRDSVREAKLSPSELKQKRNAVVKDEETDLHIMGFFTFIRAAALSSIVMDDLFPRWESEMWGIVGPSMMFLSAVVYIALFFVGMFIHTSLTAMAQKLRR